MMSKHYEKLVRDNIARLYDQENDVAKRIPALRRGKQFVFRAFGEECCIAPDGITFSEKPVGGPKALIVTLYALNAAPVPLRLEPFKAYKDFPGSMPYQGAFAMNSERVLIPHVSKIEKEKSRILSPFEGESDPKGTSGDFSFLVYPLPKIALCYIFYRADEEFPPSATCLFSSNSQDFMPLDGLADMAEYTSKEIIRLALEAP